MTTYRLREAIVENGASADDLAAFQAWRRASGEAAAKAATDRGRRSRTLPQQVLTEVKCQRRGHLLARVYRVPDGPLLWPAYARPWSGDDLAGPVKPRQDEPPIVLPSHRGGRVTDERVILLTSPPALDAYSGQTPVDLWCRCGRQQVDAIDLTRRLRHASESMVIAQRAPHSV